MNSKMAASTYASAVYLLVAAVPMILIVEQMNIIRPTTLRL